MAWLRNKYGGWFEVPDEDVKSDYISKGIVYQNQNGARIKVLDADGKSVTYRITSDKNTSLDTVSSKSEDKTVSKEGFEKMLSANGYKSKSEKERQIEANKKEAEKKNAEEKQKDGDKQKPNWIADKDNAKQYKTQGIIPAKKSAEEVLGLGKNSLKIVEKSRSAIDTEYALVHKETNQEVGRVLEGNTSKGARMWLYKIKKNK